MLSSSCTSPRLQLANTEIPSLFGIELITCLKMLNIIGCTNLTRVDGAEKLALVNLEISNCPLPVMKMWPTRTHYIQGHFSALVQECRKHRKFAHNAFLDWILAMSGLDLPIYVLLHIFDQLRDLGRQNFSKSEYKYADWRTPPVRMEGRVLIPPSGVECDDDYFDICVEDRSAFENASFIGRVYKSWNRVYQNRKK